MAATLKDVAERAGVSRSAVSRTFTDGASVSEKMRRKVEKAAEELGYQPNFLARSLTTRRTKLIGLVSDNFTNPFFLHVFDLFTSELQKRGLRPLLVNISGNHDPEPPANLGGAIVEELTDGPLHFRHEATDIPVAGEISGHFHPKATVKTRMRPISARCFVSDGRRMILPSFGAYTGGLDVNARAIRGLFAKGFRVFLLGRERLYAFPMSALAPRSAPV